MVSRLRSHEPSQSPLGTNSRSAWHSLECFLWKILVDVCPLTQLLCQRRKLRGRILPLQSTGEVQITEAIPPKPPSEVGPLDPRVVFWGLRSMATTHALSLLRESRSSRTGYRKHRSRNKPGDSGLLANGLRLPQLLIPKWCLCI